MCSAWSKIHIKILKTSESQYESGFTLVEILVAVFLLGIGLTTLIGMQSNYINAYTTEANKTRAALYANYIMTFSEINPVSPDIGSDTGDLKDKLSGLGFFDVDQLKSDNTDILQDIAGWTYTINVSGVDIGPVPGLLKRIDLRVQWSENPGDSFNLVYFYAPDISDLANSLGGGIQ